MVPSAGAWSRSWEDNQSEYAKLKPVPSRIPRMLTGSAARIPLSPPTLLHPYGGWAVVVSGDGSHGWRPGSAGHGCGR